MVARRPFGSVTALLAAADEVWADTEAGDWNEAFSHHPRIGESRAAPAESSRAAQWSAGEQSRVSTASADVQEALADLNRAYEERFGRIYIVCASGRSAEELLAVARQRLDNEPDTELRIAAEEQRKITVLRLRKLLGETT